MHGHVATVAGAVERDVETTKFDELLDVDCELLWTKKVRIEGVNGLVDLRGRFGTKSTQDHEHQVLRACPHRGRRSGQGPLDEHEDLVDVLIVLASAREQFSELQACGRKRRLVGRNERHQGRVLVSAALEPPDRPLENAGSPLATVGVVRAHCRD